MMRVTILILLMGVLAYSCSNRGLGQKRADKETAEWRYEIEAVGTGIQGFYQVKVWSYSKFPETAIEQAKKNAVHGIIFKGFPDNQRVKGQKSLFQNTTIGQEEEDFFKDFFKQGGDYQRYVTLANNGAIAPGDRIKLGRNEYKIGVVVSVNVAALRKDLEDAAIIKGLDSGF